MTETTFSPPKIEWYDCKGARKNSVKREAWDKYHGPDVDADADADADFEVNVDVGVDSSVAC